MRVCVRVRVRACACAVLYRCVSTRSMEYCTGLFVCGLEVCAHPVVGGVCSGGSWWRFKVLGVCVFVIKCLCRLWVFSVAVRLDSGNGCVV